MLRRRERARLHFADVHPSGRGRVDVDADADGAERIYLDHGLDRRERKATLMHELIHLERGVPEVDCPPLLRAKEEATVRRLTASELIPPDELRTWVNVRVEVEPVTAVDMADHFDVPVDVAVEAMRHVA